MVVMSTSKFMTKPEPSTPILVDAREASRLLSISPRTLWQLTKDQEIPSLKRRRIVRYRVTDLEAWAQQQVAAATTTTVIAAHENAVNGKEV